MVYFLKLFKITEGQNHDLMAKNHCYRIEPFITDCSNEGFFTYSSVEDLAERCENEKYKMIKCRTIGILESFNGQFFIKDLTLKSETPKIRVSLAYMMSPLQSAILPFSVQLFGTMQWRNRPVIYATLIQILSTSIAVQLNEAMLKISRTHIANRTQKENESIL